jgi:hypothetical protein
MLVISTHSWQTYFQRFLILSAIVNSIVKELIRPRVFFYFYSNEVAVYKERGNQFAHRLAVRAARSRAGRSEKDGDCKKTYQGWCHFANNGQSFIFTFRRSISC